MTVAPADAMVLPVYLVTGDDAALREEAVRALVGRLVGDADATFMVEEVRYDGASEEGAASAVAAVVDAARTPSFLAERRVVVLREVAGKDLPVGALKPLLSYLGEPLDTSSLVLVGGGGRAAKGLLDAVKRVGQVVDAGRPMGSGRRAWLDQHLRDAPVRLDPGARDLADAHLGEDLGRLGTLLDTLAAAYGAGARVSAADVEPFLGEAGSVPPWDLTDAIDSGNTPVALDALHRMTGAGERHPLQLMAVLHSHYARMLRLDGAGAADERSAAAVLGLKGSTFPAKKALAQARRLGHDGIVEAVELLADADLALRGTKGWPEGLVMEVLVARLSRLGPRAGRARPGRR